MPDRSSCDNSRLVERTWHTQKSGRSSVEGLIAVGSVHDDVFAYVLDDGFLGRRR